MDEYSHKAEKYLDLATFIQFSPAELNFNE